VSVVVEVAGGRASRVPDAPDAGLLGDIAEVKVAVVVVEPIPVGRRLLAQGRERRAVREEDVGPAVAVVIEHGESAGHRFDHVLVGGRMLLEHERQA